MSAIQLNADTFRTQVLEQKQPALVEFMAPWCVYCRRIGPAFDKIAQGRGPGLLVGKLDIDDQPQLADRYQVEVVPTLLFFKDGEPVGRIVAPDSKAKIDAFLEQYL